MPIIGCLRVMFHNPGTTFFQGSEERSYAVDGTPCIFPRKTLNGWSMVSATPHFTRLQAKLWDGGGRGVSHRIAYKKHQLPVGSLHPEDNRALSQPLYVARLPHSHASPLRLPHHQLL